MRIFLPLLLMGVALSQNGRAQDARVSDPAAARVAPEHLTYYIESVTPHDYRGRE